MKWSDVCQDKSLQDLPYKIELNEKGQLVMSPASNKHGSFQVKIALLMRKMLCGGDLIAECSIETIKGIKVADVAWTSDAFLTRHKYQTPYSVAPELCVEIVSLSNSRSEILEKVDLYLSKGANEVWVCDERGTLKFYSHSGRLPKSKMLRKFPGKIS